MASIQCKKCEYKALRQLQRTACPACETPYEFPGTVDASSETEEDTVSFGETISIPDEEYEADDDDETGATYSFTPFEARVINAMEDILSAKYWEEVRVIIEEQQEVLLSIEGCAFLCKLSAALHEAESDGLAEHIDMYIHVFEDAMEHNNDIENASMRFQSEQQLILDALKELVIAMAKGDICPVLEEKGSLLLSASTFAALYRGMRLTGTDSTDIGRSLNLVLRILYDAREGKIPTQEQLREILSEIGQKAKQKNGKITIMPGVPGVDLNDPQTALLLQEMTDLLKEEPDLFTSFATEHIRWLEPSVSGHEAPQLQGEGIPHMHALSTQLLARVSRKKQPHLWATLHTLLESFDLFTLAQSPSSFLPDFLQYDPPFSYEEAPDQWAQAIALRGFMHYQRSTGEYNQNTELAIARFTKALPVLSYERTPIEWMAVLNIRSCAYIDRKEGEPRKNTEMAIADLDTVLASLEREEYPLHWAMTSLYRCIAYLRAFYLTNERHFLEQIIADSKMILSIFIQEDMIEEWAEMLQTRGAAYDERDEGGQELNIKRALADFEAVATVLMREKEPDDWARLQVHRGVAYLRLFADDRNQNIKNALAYFNAALSVLKRETSPINWARATMNRGMAYNALMVGERKQNQEKALADLNAALEVFSEHRVPIDWGKGYLNRGNLYLERISGERRNNHQLAAVDYTNALEAFTREQAPVIHAVTLVSRGIAYRNLALPAAPDIEHDFVSLSEMFRRFMLTSGPLKFTDRYMHYFTEYQHFTKLALVDFDAALTILTPEANPREWAYACRVRATMGYDIWDFGSYQEQAARYYDEALSVFTRQSMPLEWATTLNNRATYYLHLVLNGQRHYASHVLADLDATITVFRRELAPARYRSSEYMRAQLFMVLQRWQEAHDALLRVRVVEHDLITSALDGMSQFDTVAEFSPIDIYLRDAQVLLHLQRPEEAVVALEEGRARSLRVALDIDTIDAARISDASASQRASDFLAARDAWYTLQRSAIERMQKDDSEAVGDESEMVPAVTQAHQCFLQARDAIRQYDNPDFMAPVLTWERISCALSSDDEALVYLMTGVQDGDENGLALIVTQDRAGLAVATPLTLPRLTRNALSDLFEPDQKNALPINIERAIQSLGHLVFDEVTHALLSRNIHKVRLIPYGRLGLFPLPSVYITLSDKKKRPLGEVFEVTLVPSARALEIAHERVETQRTHLLIAGNPQPLSSDWEKRPLLYAAAEAEVSCHIARKHGYLPAKIHYLRPEEATKQNVIEELQRACYAQLATHGTYNVEEPQQSQLILAGKEHIPEIERTISLSETLDGSVNLVGLRLLVLSACETSVFDIRRAPNEVVGLAAGFLQAGAVGVLAALWNVGERATYLLMTRFVELYLDPNLHLSPAQALAQAQHWLREEATNRLLSTYKPALLTLVVNGLSDTHHKILARLHKDAAAAEQNPDACMYADPKHWAAFVVTGC